MKKRTAFIGAILSLMPLGQSSLIRTGVVFSTSAGIISYSKKVNAESSRNFKNALKKWESGYFFNRAYENFSTYGKYSDAIPDFTRAIERDPNFVDAYYLRGVARLMKKDFDGAIIDLTKAIEMYPKDSTKSAYFYRGEARAKLKDFDGAILDFTKAIEINPKDGRAYYYRGVSRGLGFNDKKGTCDDFKKSASLGYQYRIDWLETSEGKWCKDM